MDEAVPRLPVLGKKIRKGQMSNCFLSAGSVSKDHPVIG
jgi:hypothetical protein